MLWDYEAAEDEISAPFDCACGSARCRGRLRGFAVHGARVLRQYGEHLVPAARRWAVRQSDAAAGGG